MLNAFLIAVGLSMDAFAASVALGCGFKKNVFARGAICSLSFGFFQGFMPLLGWYLGNISKYFITGIDHWIAFFLLSFIGGKMIYESVLIKKDKRAEKLNPVSLLSLSIATSIDALIIGISLAFLVENVWTTIIIIALTTFSLSMVGVVIGTQSRKFIGPAAQIFGGFVLFLLGISTLIKHLSGI